MWFFVWVMCKCMVGVSLEWVVLDEYEDLVMIGFCVVGYYCYGFDWVFILFCIYVVQGCSGLGCWVIIVWLYGGRSGWLFWVSCC